MDNNKPIHIFRAGRHTTVSGVTLTFSEYDIARIADVYDPAKHEAPIVLGHPKLDSPAHGWIASLKAKGSDLEATPQQVNAAFAEQFRAGAFKKVSAAFYPPEHPGNPVPGGYYLRHLGVLGAQPPSLKGLRPAEFADDGDGLVEIEFAEGSADNLLQRLLAGIEQLLEKKPAAKPSFSEPQTQESEMDEAELRRQQEKLDAERKAFADEQAAFAERQQDVTDREKRQARASAVEFAEGLAKAGKILPRHKNRVVELLHGLNGMSETLSFAEGDDQVKANPLETLKGFLNELPNLVEYAEQAAAEDEGAGVQTSFRAPEGAAVDPESLALHNKAAAYAEANNVDYDVAAMRVSPH